MAVKLEPGELSVRLHSGRDLKNCDWFGQQDPYVIIRCGNMKFRSNTHVGGGTNPIWDQLYVFKVDKEIELDLEVWDEDTGKADDCVGKGKIELVTVRQSVTRQHELEVPLFRRISRRQHGYLRVTLTFRPASAPAGEATPGPGSATYAVHQAQAASLSAAAVAVASTAAGSTSAASREQLAPPLSTTSVPAGSVKAGEAPDNVPKYEPSCGLITPQPHQLLPCHQGRISGSNLAADPQPQQAPQPHAVPASPYYAQPPPQAAPPYPPAAQQSYPPAAQQSYPQVAQQSWGPAPSLPPPHPQPPYGAPPDSSSMYGYPPKHPPAYAGGAPPAYGAPPPAYSFSAPPAYADSSYGAPPAAPYGAPPPAHGTPPPVYGAAPSQHYAAPPPYPPPYGAPPPPGPYGPPQVPVPGGYSGYGH